MKKTSLIKRIIIKVAAITVLFFIIGIIYTYYELSKGKELTRLKEANYYKKLILTDVDTKLDAAVSIALSTANNVDVIKALKNNNRKLALKTLQKIMSEFKNNTKYKHLKLHIHTKDIHSFLRAWKPKKFGDDLSGFRATIVHVANTHKALRAIEVGRAGLVIRGLAPIFDENGAYLGSIECILGYMSVLCKVISLVLQKLCSLCFSLMGFCQKYYGAVQDLLMLLSAERFPGRPSICPAPSDGQHGGTP